MVPTINRKKNPLGDEFVTPEWVWKPWHQVLNFVIDAASSCSNKLPFSKGCWTKDYTNKDGSKGSLNMPLGYWTNACKYYVGAVWLNPPYSRKAGPLEKWVQKCLDEASLGATICALLPADTSTRWFSLLWDRDHGIPRRGVDLRFIEGRIHFIHPRTGKPTKEAPNFGSLIVIFTKPY